MDEEQRMERQWAKDDAAQAEHSDRCPHKDRIQFCPLYVASHVATSRFGCVDDMARPCRVVRGEMDYAGTVAVMRIAEPAIVGQCEFGKMLHYAANTPSLFLYFGGPGGILRIWQSPKPSRS